MFRYSKHVCAMVAAAGSMVAGAAWGACTLTFSPATLNFGAQMAASLPASDVAGYKLLGQGRGTLTGVCDTAANAVALRFANLTNVSTSPPLFSWVHASGMGALALKISDAKVGGVPVNMVLRGGSPVATATIDLAATNSTIDFDFTGVPAGDGRKLFSVDVQVKGLVNNTYAPSISADFVTMPQVDLLP